MKSLILCFVFIIGSPVFGQMDDGSAVLMSEWSKFRKMVETLEPDEEVAGYYKSKAFGDVLLMWRISEDSSDDEVIRFYVEREGEEKYFNVTYHKNKSIVPGRQVLRRFLGTEPSGWKNHTIDFNSGEYLGSQGAWRPDVSEKNMEVLNEWGITLLLND